MTSQYFFQVLLSRVDRTSWYCLMYSCILWCLVFVMNAWTALLSKVGLFCCMRTLVWTLRCWNISGLLHCASIERGKQFPLPSVISSRLSGSWSLLTVSMISSAIIHSLSVAIFPWNETISLIWQFKVSNYCNLLLKSYFKKEKKVKSSLLRNTW